LFASSGVYFWRYLVASSNWLSGANLIFEVTKQTAGNFALHLIEQNILNLFRNDSECFQISKMSTIAGHPVLKTLNQAEND
jgi:hypothetical protein